MTSRTRARARGGRSRMPSAQLSPDGRTLQPSTLSSLNEIYADEEVGPGNQNSTENGTSASRQQLPPEGTVGPSLERPAGWVSTEPFSVPRATPLTTVPLTGGRPAPSPAAEPASKRARAAGSARTSRLPELSPSAVDRALREAVPVARMSVPQEGNDTESGSRPVQTGVRSTPLARRGISESVHTTRSSSPGECSPRSPMVTEEETRTVVTLPDDVFLRILRSFGCDVGKQDTMILWAFEFKAVLCNPSEIEM
ncbi:hypothetical protein H2248_006581 [Termitomyces sp. 'cryptogamus']|nr:hypothetical protein H2248_006581 [Termitomyces sp. 'cryptogamus']